SGIATLNLTGGQVLTQTTNASTTVAAGVTISSDSQIVMNVSNSTLTIGGTVTSSAAGPVPIITLNTPGLTLNTNGLVKAQTVSAIGTGGLTLAGDGTGTIWGTSTTAGTPGPTGINLTTVNSSTSVTFASSVLLKTGDGTTLNNGTVNINAGNPDGTQSIVLNNGVTVSSNGVVELNTCTLLGGGTVSAPTV